MIKNKVKKIGYALLATGLVAAPMAANATGTDPTADLTTAATTAITAILGTLGTIYVAGIAIPVATKMYRIIRTAIKGA